MVVTLPDEVKVERGDEAVSRSELKTGQHVSVFGTTLASGELMAREVIIHGAERDHGEGHHGSPRSE